VFAAGAILAGFGHSEFTSIANSAAVFGAENAK
jgi:hypothetical protein